MLHPYLIRMICQAKLIHPSLCEREGRAVCSFRELFSLHKPPLLDSGEQFDWRVLLFFHVFSPWRPLTSASEWPFVCHLSCKEVDAANVGLQHLAEDLLELRIALCDQIELVEHAHPRLRRLQALRMRKTGAELGRRTESL